MTNLKFKYNYLQNTLAYQTKTTEKNTWYQLTEDRQFIYFQSQGFKLGSQLNKGWITFTAQAHKIQAFYKHWVAPWQIIRYRKDLPKECPVIFEFTEADQVEKIGNSWVKKGGKQ